MNSLKAFFLEQIKEATTADELDYIIERASWDLENPDDVCELHDIAFKKLQSWQAI